MLRKPIVLMMSVVSVLAALALATAGSASAAQRIDMKVLVLGTSSTEPDFLSWQSALQREGVPFEAIVDLARASGDHRRDPLGHPSERHRGGQVPGGHRLGRSASRMHRIGLCLNPLAGRMDGA